MNQRYKTLSGLIISGLAAATLPTQLMAQSGLVLEEVIVTARKREQSLQDVSVAVSSLSASDLIANQILNSEDLATLVPSLNVQKGGNPRQSSFNIRGIGTQSFSSGVEQSVSTMIDGVVMGRSMSAFMQLLDVERIEVLRGPQGTLFGKNSTGGVVHIITQDPVEEFEMGMMGAVEEGEQYRLGLNVSAPITDNLAFRLSGSYTDTDGWVKNHYTGGDLNGGEENAVRGKLLWTPADSLEFKWSSDYADNECDCTTNIIRSMDPYNGNDALVDSLLEELAPVVPGEENDEVNVDGAVYNDWDNWGHSLEANWGIGEFTLTSITAYRESSLEALEDNDQRPTKPNGFEQYGNTDQDQLTQEIRLTSPADQRFSYVAGFFYFDQTIDRQFYRGFEFFPGQPGLNVADFSVDVDNWALFGEGTFSINDRLRLIAGARYTDDELEYDFKRSNEGFPVGLQPAVEGATGSTQEDDTSGKLALEWDYSDDAMAYVSYSEGYKGPAFDVTIGTDPTTLMAVDPELSESWEIGFKSNLLDNRLMLNIALFHTEYDDFQTQAFLDPDGPSGCPPDNQGCNPDDEPGSFELINAGDVETEGVEIDFVALATENLRISGGVAFVDASIVDFPGGKCSFGQEFRGECFGTQDLSGGDLPFSPDWKASLTTQYTLPLNWSFEVQLLATIKAQDDILYDLSQDENTIAEGYEILDLSVRLRDQADRWDAAFYVKNATDEFYVSSIASTSDFFLPNAYLQRVPRHAERTFGAEVRYRF